MALQKTENFKAVEASYWKVEELKYTDKLGIVMLKVGLYKDKAAADESFDNALSYRVYKFDEENDVDIQAAKDSLKALCYTKLKTLEDFDGAIDA